MSREKRPHACGRFTVQSDGVYRLDRSTRRPLARLPFYFAVLSAAAIALFACAIASLIAALTQGGSVSTELG